MAGRYLGHQLEMFHRKPFMSKGNRHASLAWKAGTLAIEIHPHMVDNPSSAYVPCCSTMFPDVFPKLGTVGTLFAQIKGLKLFNDPCPGSTVADH